MIYTRFSLSHCYTRSVLKMEFWRQSEWEAVSSYSKKLIRTEIIPHFESNLTNKLG